MRRDPAIWLLAAGQTLIWAAIYYSFPALLPAWVAATGWSKAELTAGITLAVLTSAMMSPVAGRLIDAGHGRAVMAGGAVLGGLAMLVLTGVGALWQFLSVWVVAGIAMAGALYEPCFAVVIRARGAEARPAIIRITLTAGFASSLAFPTMHLLTNTFGEWQGAAAVAGGVAILLAAPMLWAGVGLLERGTGPEGAEPEGAGPTAAAGGSALRMARKGPVLDGSGRPIRWSPVFWCLAIGFACLGIAHGAVLHHLLLLLAERDVAEGAAILIASLVGPMQVAGRVVMMLAMRRASNHAVALGAFLGIGVSLPVLMAAGTGFGWLLVFVAAFGGAYGIVSVIRPVIARDILGGARFGAKSGALAVPYLAGAATAPWIGALIWGAGGYGLMLGVMTAAVAAGLGLYLAAQRMAGGPGGGAQGTMS